MKILENWLNNGWLVRHKTSRNEIAELFQVAERDLNDCRSEGLSPHWRLAIAYNAALQLATAVLAATGYRSAREAHHYRVIQSLRYTIPLDTTVVVQLDAFRKKRNIGGYERAWMVSDQEADEMLSLARDLRTKVEKWFRSTFPDLIT